MPNRQSANVANERKISRQNRKENVSSIKRIRNKKEQALQGKTNFYKGRKKVGIFKLIQNLY